MEVLNIHKQIIIQRNVIYSKLIDGFLTEILSSAAVTASQKLFCDHCPVYSVTFSEIFISTH